jgi:hypothetical protein
MKVALLVLFSTYVNVAISLPSAAAASSSSIQVMTTPTAGLLQWTCFAPTKISKDDCCREISDAYFHTYEKRLGPADCLAVIAPVPTELLEEQQDATLVSNLAQYSLFTVSNQESGTPDPVHHSPPQIQLQLLWNAANRTSQEIISSPLLLEQEEQATRNIPLIKASLRSSLDVSGGMHREFHHAIHIQVDRGLRHWKATFYMALYVPQHFFVDVDDALGKLECGDAQSCHAEFIHSHVIDIEQPAFESPQHVTWIKLDVTSRRHKHQAHLKLTSKFHIRYPSPLQVLGDVWTTVELPLPQLIFGIYQLDGEDLHRTWHASQQRHDDPVAIPIAVAAGNQHDYPWVVGITIICCLLGVATMLNDIVQVSQWD